MRNKQCSDKGECFMGKCICKPGYTGENCGTELPCDCSGHGVCHGGACVCNPGFKGTNCATAEYCPGKTLTSPQGCSDNGVCNDGACFCFDGYAGDSCAFNIQDGKERDRLKNCINPDVPSDGAKSCSGHGVCGYDKLNKPKNQGGQEFGTCLCVPGFGGEYCEEEKKCPKDCNGHGSCHGGVCTCRYGYRGDGCETLDLGIDLCPNNCGDHGKCFIYIFNIVEFDMIFCAKVFFFCQCKQRVPM
jgi:syndecan 4